MKTECPTTTATESCPEPEAKSWLRSIGDEHDEPTGNTSLVLDVETCSFQPRKSKADKSIHDCPEFPKATRFFFRKGRQQRC